MSVPYETLRRFLFDEMRMPHIYQPLMIKTLLTSVGRAPTRQIAAAFLAEDESQLEYYEAITNRMPGPVLRRRDIVTREGDGYSLRQDVRDLSMDERHRLMADDQSAHSPPTCSSPVTQCRRERGNRNFSFPNASKDLVHPPGSFSGKSNSAARCGTVRRRKLALFLLASDTKKTGERIVAFVARELEHSFVGSLER